MGILEIHCHNCGAAYEVHPDIVIDADKLQTGVRPYCCPHCFAQMNIRTWDKLVTAYWTLWEVNKELLDEHTGYRDRPLFQATYKSLGVPLHRDYFGDS